AGLKHTGRTTCTVKARAGTTLHFKEYSSMSASTALRSVFTGSVIARIVLGWLAVLILSLTSSFLASGLSTPLVFLVLAAIVAVIIVCSGGVVTQAEHLAHRLGDPYGTLVLTLSIVAIEVILISAVMLGPGDHQTIARDSVMATVMIVLNLVIGLALIVGGMRHDNLRVNRTGISTYLSMLVVLIATDVSYDVGQAITIITLTIVLYGFFLYRQTGAQHSDYIEVMQAPGAAEEPASHSPGIGVILREHKGEILTRAVVLLITVIP